LRLAADVSAARLTLPEDRGQPWAAWLWEWATYAYHAFVEQPELIRQFMEGAIATHRTADVYEGVLRRLIDDGFSVAQAFAAYQSIAQYAMGAAVGEIRERNNRAMGQPTLAAFQQLFATDPDGYRSIEAVVADLTAHPRDPFGEGLLLVLRGIADTRGESWASVEASLRAATGDRS
jgi:hypothetical protein